MFSRRLSLIWFAGIFVALGAIMASGCFGGGSNEPAPATAAATDTPPATKPAKPTVTPVGYLPPGVTPTARPTPTVTGELFGLKPRELVAGDPVTLPDGFSQLGIVTRTEKPQPYITITVRQDLVRTEKAPDGTLKTTVLSDFQDEYLSQYPSTERFHPGLSSWAAGESGQAIYAMLCVGPKSCSCGVQTSPEGAALFQSVDFGGTWNQIGVFDGAIRVVGVDPDGKAIVSRRKGCSTVGSADYWTEPGHTPVPRATRCDQACYYGYVPGLGWKWQALGVPMELDGTSLLPAIFRNATRGPVLFTSEGSYWSQVTTRNGTYLVFVDSKGSPTMAWHAQADYLNWGKSLGNGIFFGSVNRPAPTPEDPDIVKSWRILIDLNTGLIHDIEGFEPIER